MLPDMIEWRRHIHRNAELSFEEYNTQSYVCAILDRHGIVYKQVANTGVLAVINGVTDNAKHPVILRADMDALPIHEDSNIPFACPTGVMHACGHDMHTSALLGAMIMLNDRREEFSGTIWGLFQPGEERWPGGASIIIEQGVFNDVEPLGFVGGHVSPELKVGEIGLRSGEFMASSDEIQIQVIGQGGHGAQPHLLRDPIVASAAIILALQQVVSRNSEPFSPSVLSFGHIQAEGATNIIPNTVNISGTLRTLDQIWRQRALERIKTIVHSTGEAYGVETIVDIHTGYPLVYNNPELTNLGCNVVRATFSEHSLIEVPKRMTAEDFGFYSERYPSLFFRWGVDSKSPLHNCSFEPREEALSYGAAFMAAMALDIIELRHT